MDVSGIGMGGGMGGGGSTALSLSDPQASALSGMADAQNKMADAAQKMTTGPATPEVVLDLSNAQMQFAAGAEVLKTSQENTRKLLDVLA